MTFLREYKDEDEPKEKQGGLWDFDEDFDFEDNLVAFDQKHEDSIICCCKKEIPHDESIKFILKADEQHLRTTLFKNRGMGQIIQLHDKNSQHRPPIIFDNAWLIGRNLETQRIVEMLTNTNS